MSVTPVLYEYVCYVINVFFQGFHKSLTENQLKVSPEDNNRFIILRRL